MFRQLPNTLTALRLLSAPVLAAFLLYGHEKYAFVVFAFAGLTDLLDGYLAKRFGLTTSVGRYLDPAADKFLMLAAFLALTAIQLTPLWLMVVVIGRDAAIVSGILVARLLGLPLRIEPLPIGKVCTAVQVCYVALLLFLLALRIDASKLVEAAGLVTAAVTIASWLAYAGLLLKAFAARYRSVV